YRWVQSAQKCTANNVGRHNKAVLEIVRIHITVKNRGVDTGPGCMRTRPPGASVNRRYGHHGHRPTAGHSGVYHCPDPGPERGYHPHGLYLASARTGAGRHTAAPAVQQRHLSSASVWRGSVPRPDDGISLTAGITADGLHIFG